LNKLTGTFSSDASCASGGVGAYNHTVAYNAIGNITNYNGNAYTYGAKPHAVTAAFSNTYTYDANGNQTLRQIASYTHTLTYDAQGRMTTVSSVREPVTNTITATFLYDADGIRVKGLVNGVTTVYIAGTYEWQAGATTVYIAGIFEWQAGATTKYFDGGGMRRSGYATGNGVFYILSDQLGSTSVIVSQAGAVQATNYYYPFGTNRAGISFSDLTSKRFTGQYAESGLGGSEGLSYYGARWYDAQLGRFASPDSLVPRPNDPQSFNRFAYARDNPVNRTDPTGYSDSCNSSLYNCNSGGSSSDDPVDYQSWNASQWQRAHARSVPKHYNWNKTTSTKHYVFLCGINIRCPDNIQFGQLDRKIVDKGGSVHYITTETHGRSSYADVQKELDTDIGGLPAGDLYLIGHSAGANNIVFYMSQRISDHKDVSRFGGVVLLEPELKTGSTIGTSEGKQYSDSQAHGRMVIDALGVNKVLVVRTNTALDNFPTGCGSGSQTCQFREYPNLVHLELPTDPEVARDIFDWLSQR
jgi:RHS repeat-associated protein